MENSPARRRLGFAGTPPFAASILAELTVRHEIPVVYTQSAKRVGRGRRIAPSAVEHLARLRGIDVRTPRSLRDEASSLAALHLDALIVVAYGLILPKAILQLPQYGCINVHASLLPRWRGAAPIERAIMAGDRQTGITIMQMDEGLDTGPVLRQVACPIEADDTGDSLRDRLAAVATTTLLQCLDQLERLLPTPQSREGVTYASKLTRSDSVIDWTHPASELALKIRALNSRQPAFCVLGDRRMRVLHANSVERGRDSKPGEVLSVAPTSIIVSCGIGALEITRVALSIGSGKPMDVSALLNGYPDLLRRGQVLDTSA